KALHVQTRYAAEGITKIKELIDRIPDDKGRVFWRTFLDCQKINPRATKVVLMMMVVYLHVGPFGRWLADQVEARLAETGRNGDLIPQQRPAQATALSPL